MGTYSRIVSSRGLCCPYLAAKGHITRHDITGMAGQLALCLLRACCRAFRSVCSLSSLLRVAMHPQLQGRWVAHAKRAGATKSQLPRCGTDVNRDVAHWTQLQSSDCTGASMLCQYQLLRTAALWPGHRPLRTLNSFPGRNPHARRPNACGNGRAFFACWLLLDTFPSRL